MRLESVRLDAEKRAVVILDQTKLPGSVCYTELRTLEQVWEAIQALRVRGAPAIGVCAAFGIYLEAERIAEKIGSSKYLEFWQAFGRAKEYLASARPTAVNLFWALAEMENTVLQNRDRPVERIIDCLQKRALAMYEEDIRVCRAIGEYGLTLIGDCKGILTHCNAGELATVRYGTALAPIYLGFEAGKRFRVYVDETRPLLQGARLTALELASAGLDVTLICDNMAAAAMKNGWIQAVLVGCDRVALNGDTANKIGTLSVAVLAKRFGIPFYVCAPTATIDPTCPSGDQIVIEERQPDEITEMWYRERMAPENIRVWNPAFDVTDADLISAIVTEFGIIRPPYRQTLMEILDKKKQGAAL